MPSLRISPFLIVSPVPMVADILCGIIMYCVVHARVQCHAISIGDLVLFHFPMLVHSDCRVFGVLQLVFWYLDER